LSTINISQSDLKEIKAYCKLNNISDTEAFIKSCFDKGYYLEKYGLLDDSGKPKVVEKEVIKEVIVEVEKIVEKPVIEYVDVIREVEKEIEKVVEIIKEVPVEVIKEVEKVVEVVKEVPVDRVVEKIIEVTKEVPVEKVVIQEVVKEVPVDRVVEKEVYITDDSQVKELGDKVAKLNDGRNELLLKIQQLESDKQLFSTKIDELEGERQKFSTKTEEMENIFQNKMSKKDEELDKLRHSLDELLAKPPVVVKNETTDNSKQKALEETLQKLRGQMIEKDKKIKELEKTIEDIQSMGGKGATYLSGSNLGRTFK